MSLETQLQWHRALNVLLLLAWGWTLLQWRQTLHRWKASCQRWAALAASRHLLREREDD